RPRPRSSCRSRGTPAAPRAGGRPRGRSLPQPDDDKGGDEHGDHGGHGAVDDGLGLALVFHACPAGGARISALTTLSSSACSARCSGMWHSLISAARVAWRVAWPCTYERRSASAHARSTVRWPLPGMMILEKTERAGPREARS